MANVLLLRTPTQHDKYNDAFRTLGYNPITVPVLDTILTNMDSLKSVIQSGPSSSGYGGVVITSARACEAWEQAVHQLTALSSSLAKEALTDSWSTTPFYVVGEKTADALRQVYKTSGNSPLAPFDIRGAAESGTSEKLARFIADNLRGSPSLVLLYLTGDKNRDTFTETLRSCGGPMYKTMQVYATQGSPKFSDDLREAILSAPREYERWWIVFFAPSVADFVTPILREYFIIPTLDNVVCEGLGKRACKLAAIGSTTASHLRDVLKLDVDAIAPKPNPMDLSSTIALSDRV